MIMNDPIFSYFMAVKEFEHSSKKTAGLYTQFFLQGGETGTCSITSKFVTEDDQETKGVDMEDGTPFIRLRLKSSSQANIEDFLRIFSKLIGLYRKKEPFIDEEYKEYGVSTDDEFRKVDLKEKKTLWDFEPKIFLKGYARHSGKYPRIVEEKEASDIPNEKKMLFPRIPIEGTTKPQRWYSCDHHSPSHPYIGLKINNSANKDKVPVLPSCFIADQTNSSMMKDYLSGKTISKKEHIQQIIITTDKFVQNDALGNLPKSLDELLLSLEKENVIKNILEEVRDQYDFIIIDCSPSLGLITVNALVAADSVAIPVQAEFFALEGLGKLLNTIKIVQSRLNTSLEIEGILMTMYDGRLRLCNQIVNEVRRHFEEMVFETLIHRNSKLSEAPSVGKPVILYDAESKGSINYLNLAKEILQKNNMTNINQSERILNTGNE
jgi:cellulose biosynthesis protein BcsQ